MANNTDTKQIIAEVPKGLAIRFKALLAQQDITYRDWLIDQIVKYGKESTGKNWRRPYEPKIRK